MSTSITVAGICILLDSASYSKEDLKILKGWRKARSIAELQDSALSAEGKAHIMELLPKFPAPKPETNYRITVTYGGNSKSFVESVEIPVTANITFEEAMEKLSPEKAARLALKVWQKLINPATTETKTTANPAKTWTVQELFKKIQLPMNYCHPNILENARLVFVDGMWILDFERKWFTTQQLVTDEYQGNISSLKGKKLPFGTEIIAEVKYACDGKGVKYTWGSTSLDGLTCSRLSFWL